LLWCRRGACYSFGLRGACAAIRTDTLFRLVNETPSDGTRGPSTTLKDTTAKQAHWSLRLNASASSPVAPAQGAETPGALPWAKLSDPCGVENHKTPPDFGHGISTQAPDSCFRTPYLSLPTVFCLFDS